MSDEHTSTFDSDFQLESDATQLSSASVQRTIANTLYASQCKELLALRQDLEGLGAGMFFDMPRIAVIGSQSAGKSSLVEAVSGINVPRDSGTCTRCPMEISMSTESHSWSCNISLCQNTVDRYGVARTERTPFGPTITDKGEIELWLRRAQAAMLSPHIDSDEFHSMSIEALREAIRTDKDMLLFCEDIVGVEIKDPDLTDLHFVDLPGLIQNSEPEIIELVRNLVVSHIEGVNTLILIAIPVTDDIENQQAMVLAREADPFGERTIGVLTKPDALTPGATTMRRKWKSIIRGEFEEHRLKHGYYCVRLLDDEERATAVSRAEAREIETDLFSTPAWSDTDQNRCGVPNLVSDISGLLVRLIAKNLPALKSRIDDSLRECRKGLNELPPPIPGDPVTEVLSRVRNFCDSFKEAVISEGDSLEFVQGNRKEYTKFMERIHQTCPDFRPFENHTKYSNLNTLKGPGRYAGPPLDLSAVQSRIENSIGWELPDFVPFKAAKRLIQDIVKQWKEPSSSCFEAVYESSVKLLDGLMDHHFGQFRCLKEHAISVVQAELETCKTSAIQRIEKTLQLELTPIFTQNTDHLASEKLKWHSAYINLRKNQSEFVINRRGLSDEEINDIITSNVEINDTKDQFSNALEIMAHVRAYFQVSYKRIIDTIPLVIEQEMNQGLAETLYERLLETLPREQDAAAKMRALLREDPMLANKRAVLEERRKQLQLIKARLDSFHRGVGSRY